MTIQITQIAPGGHLDDFIAVPRVLYRDDPNYIQPLDMMIRQQLSPKTNPFFEHAEGALFVARRDGALVGRISAQIDREHLSRHQDETGFFGFFDTTDDEEVARTLIDAAAHWLSARGMKHMRGPLSLSINEECGMLVKGFEYPSVLLNAHHKPHQQRMAEAAGLEKAKDLYGFLWHTHALGKRAQRAFDTVAAYPEVRIRQADMKRETEQFIKIQDDAWRDNWGHVSLTQAEVDQYKKDLALLLDPRLALVADIDGEPAAICLAAPNLNEVVADLNGKLLPFGLFKLIYRLKVKRPKSGRLIMLGIKKEYREQKRYGYLAMALVAEMAKRGQQLGYEWAELGWTLEDNGAVNALCRAAGAKHYKTYRIFEKALSE